MRSLSIRGDSSPAECQTCSVIARVARRLMCLMPTVSTVTPIWRDAAKRGWINRPARAYHLPQLPTCDAPVHEAGVKVYTADTMPSPVAQPRTNPGIVHGPVFGTGCRRFESGQRRHTPARAWIPLKRQVTQLPTKARVSVYTADTTASLMRWRADLLRPCAERYTRSTEQTRCFRHLVTSPHG
jgi:hypothetical protein